MWVADSGLTLDRDGRNYCRFCYAELRNSGSLKKRQEDSHLLDAVKRENSRELAAVKSVTGSGVLRKCPCCSHKLRIRKRSAQPIKKRMAACPVCRAMLEIHADRIQWSRATRMHMMNSVAYRLGLSPATVEDVVHFFFDELAAQMAEGKYVPFKELGSFSIVTDAKSPAGSVKGVKIGFASSKQFRKLIQDRMDALGKPQT